jgi:pilus assembly protein CpaF
VATRAPVSGPPAPSAEPKGGPARGASLGDTADLAAINPLAELESLVQARAKELDLDLANADSKDRLRSLITSEIEQWHDEVRRGNRRIDLPRGPELADRAFRNLALYGPLTDLLADPDVWEIMVNSPDAVFVKRHSAPSGFHHEVFHDDEHVVRTLSRLLDDSSTAHRKLDATEGLQDAQLDDGGRLHIVHRDVARGGHMMFNIRKFTGVGFTSIEQLIARGMLTTAAARFLIACVQSRLSIVFAGAPGAGKTTLLNCCAGHLDPSLRVVTAEEVFEVDIPIANVASMQTRAARVDRPPVDLRRLVAGFLRMAPDIAIVGEVRDKEALPLLLTLSSGVKGYTTIHAGSARQALTRLRFICQLADSSTQIPMSALNTLVSEAVDVVVHAARGPRGPVVNEILTVEDLAGGPEATQFTTTPVFNRPSPNAALGWTGMVPVRAGEALGRAGFDVAALLNDGYLAGRPSPGPGSDQRSGATRPAVGTSA